jgi:hypothetical protein
MTGSRRVVLVGQVTIPPDPPRFTVAGTRAVVSTSRCTCLADGGWMGKVGKGSLPIAAWTPTVPCARRSSMVEPALEPTIPPAIF